MCQGKKICVVGGGRWGQNHIKTLYNLKSLSGIADNDAERLKALSEKYPGVRTYSDVQDALDDGFDGFVVATPAPTHFNVGKLLLSRGNSVLIEKPLCLNSKDSQELINICRGSNSKLMVGHVLLFHPAIKKIKEVIEEGRIGEILHIYSSRLNLGTVRTEENVLWSFTPHDISVVNYLTGSFPVDMDISGGAFLTEGIEDVITVNLSYTNNAKAVIYASWLYPFKEQKLIIVGSKGMLSYDDASGKQIILHDKGIDWVNGIPAKREGASLIIEYENTLPLENELKYFIENLDRGFTTAEGESGHDVVKILEQLSQKLKSNS